MTGMCIFYVHHIYKSSFAFFLSLYLSLLFFLSLLLSSSHAFVCASYLSCTCHAMAHKQYHSNNNLKQQTESKKKKKMNKKSETREMEITMALTIYIFYDKPMTMMLTGNDSKMTMTMNSESAIIGTGWIPVMKILVLHCLMAYQSSNFWRYVRHCT